MIWRESAHLLTAMAAKSEEDLVDFNGKVVVVTGAGSGIGREIALAFAKRGARIAGADIDEQGLNDVCNHLGSLGCVAYAQEVDVSRPEQVGDFCDRVYREMGRVDVLCNNAGVAIGGYMEDVALEDWEWIVGINLLGVVYGCHFFYPRMIEQGGGGHIVNLASAAGLIPAVGSVAYSTTKYGVVGLSETLRAEAALHGIGVSAICPSFVLTGIYRSARQRSIPEWEDPEVALRTAESILKRRRCTAATVAEAVVGAVEKNVGVVRVCPETYLLDFLHRGSRRAFGYLAMRLARAGQNAQWKNRVKIGD